MNSFANQRSEAAFSPCGQYRFWLAREWGMFGTFGVFLCHNPSTADALTIDATTMRCNNLAVRWNWRGFGIVNIIPSITADLSGARAMTFPSDIGDLNDTWIRRSRSIADIFVVAVGEEGHTDAIRTINRLSLAPPFHAIQENVNGSCLHPAAIRSDKSFDLPQPISFPDVRTQ